MNQRVRRSSKKKNRIDFVSMATGGHNTLRGTDGKGEVQVPKPTEKPKKKGLAKGSPFFKRLKKTEVPSALDQGKALAKNEIKDKEDKKKTPDKK